ncbi:hypothetical protein M9458_021149, partial [Cirrhinus mrigala]
VTIQDADNETHLSCLRHQDWFAAVDLEDAYFHVSILPRHRPVLRFAVKVGHISTTGQLGKEQTLPCAEDLFSQFGAGFGQQVGTPHERACPVGAELSELVQTQDGSPPLLFQRLLGHMAAAAAVTPLGLLHMRPLQHWLYGRIPRWAWHHGTFRAGASLECRHPNSPWSDHVFYGPLCPWVSQDLDCSGNSLPRVARNAFGAASVSPVLRDKHVPIRTDNVPTVAYITGRVVCASVIATRPPSPPVESDAAQIAAGRSHSGRAESCGRCASRQVRLFPSESPCTDSVQGQGGWGAGLLGCALLAHQDLVCRPHAPRDSPSLRDSPEEGRSFSGDGHNLAPASRPLEPPYGASGRDSAQLTGLPQAVINTITQARAPSTRQAYALKWGLFADWRSSCQEDLQRCSVSVVLSFRQDKVGAEAVPLHFTSLCGGHRCIPWCIDGLSLRKHHLIARLARTSLPLGFPP